MKGRKFLVFLMVAAMVVCTMLALASCGLLEEEGEAPFVKNIEILKASADYKKSNEYLYNSETNNAVAVERGGSFLLSLEYENKSGYAISYVTVNTDKIMPSVFEVGSDKKHTVIEIKVPEDKEGEISYTVKNVFYNTGKKTSRMAMEKGVNTEFKINVAPSFKLTLNYQNADGRSTTTKPVDDVAVGNTSIPFGSALNTTGVTDKNYADPVGLPTKDGGFVFEGWYTKPNGEGFLVSSSDKYYFWSDVTLYAHYSRLFEYKIVELDEPIEHDYVGMEMSNNKLQQVSGTKTFTSAAIITNYRFREYPSMSIYDTIVDEKAVLDENSGKVTIVSSEYPVIKVENKACQNNNSILDLYIGKYVEEIGAFAFDNCNKLERVTFGEGSRLKYIGDYAFQNTRAMGITSSVTLPQTVEYLGNFAFRYSGWQITNNNGVNESIFHVRPSYKFIGAGCFFNTKFREVVFDAGCKFEGQINESEAQTLDAASGWSSVHADENRIGARIFANCPNIVTVRFESDDNDALNIIPDTAFDAGNYTVTGISLLTLAEGIEFIGNMAFNYQGSIPYLEIPATVKEIGRQAFYNCVSVTDLKFKDGSVLETLHTRCFGNMASIDRVVIISTEFKKYGNGPFAGCGRLKSIEFPNVFDPSAVPMGFSREENSDEVTIQHKYSDLMFGTFENGNDGSQSSYSLPTRVFCQNQVMDSFKNNILAGKGTYLFNDDGTETTVAAPSTFNNVVFVHNINNIIKYENPTAATGEDREVDVALQEVYDRSGRIVGYSIVYWAYRSRNITLPSSAGTLGNYPVIELAMYALPTSVINLTVPANITRLEHDALNGCTQLEEVIFEDKDTLEYVGDYAFFGTKITSFEGGTNLKVIGQNAFMRCTSLRWVDLQNTAITNPPVNGRTQYIQRYKYSYELKDNNNKDAVDYVDVLYDGAFQGCYSMSWVSLPTGLKQVSNALFTGCRALRTVIIPCTGVSTSIEQTDDYAFYYRSLPAAIYDSTAVPYMTIYVPNSTELATHQRIYAQARYDLIGNAPSHP